MKYPRVTFIFLLSIIVDGMFIWPEAIHDLLSTWDIHIIRNRLNTLYNSEEIPTTNIIKCHSITKHFALNWICYVFILYTYIIISYLIHSLLVKYQIYIFALQDVFAPPFTIYIIHAIFECIRSTVYINRLMFKIVRA